MAARKPKYRKGDLVTSVGAAADAIINQHACLYLGDKCQNWAWLQNMSLWTLDRYVRNGQVCFAVDNNKEKARG